MLRDPYSIQLEALADYDIQKIEQNFDTVIIHLYDSDIKASVIIRCKEYIGYEVLGVWDDFIVRNITIETSGSFIDKSLLRVKELYGNPEEPYYTKSFNSGWKQVTIKLIDGVEMRVACKDIEVDY